MTRRNGTVLLAVLIITAMAAMAATVLMYRMQAELIAAGPGAHQRDQAYLAAISGIQYVSALLEKAPGDWTFWYDNPEVFQNQMVVQDGVDTWYFTVYAEVPPDPSGAERADQIRYGVTDQAGRINLNTADADTLLALPGMTQELVDCLIDYRDRDSDPRPTGAEQEYYEQLPHPYAIKNGPLITLEEVLLVKGFHGRIVYGEDANQNGMMEANEDDGDESFPPDDADGVLNIGLRGSATTISYEFNVDNDGNARGNLNSGSAAVRKAGLGRQTQEFVGAYLAGKNTFKHPAELLEMEYRLEKKYGRYPAGTTLHSGVGAEELPTVLDRLTVMPSSKVPQLGLVNVNTAPPAVLLALGLDEELVGAIAATRSPDGGLAAEERATTAWLYTRGLVDAGTFKHLAPKLTARGFQYHVRCIGFGHPSGRYRILEAVIDVAKGTPRISYLRDITRLGLPHALDPAQQEQSQSW